ncbi:YczE/YyaS/YitT family protein [Lactiplantibacillus plantarum]
MLNIPDFRQRFGFLVFSIILNSAANALTIATSLGSAVWTGSSVNLADWTHISLGTTLLLYGVVVTILNQLLLGHFDRRRFISNLLYIVPFSYLVQFIGYFWDWLQIPALPLLPRLILNVLGLLGVAAAVSIYQRCNLIQHPNDDLSYILRFRFLHGSAIIAQWTSYLPPLTIIIVSFFATGHLRAIGFGTAFALIAQGAIMGWSAHHVFPHLKHHVDIVQAHHPA